MNGLLVTIGMSLGGWLGWWLGAKVGLVTAVMLSGIGMAAGLYYTRRLIQEYLE